MGTVSIYDQFNKLTPQEQSYIKRHPHHAFSIKEAKELAFKETVKRFGKNGHNDRSDAFRHCFWSALLASEIGYSGALNFTTAHESSPTNDPREKEMDLHNNHVGLNIGRTPSSSQTLSIQCMTALAAGKLKVLVK